MVQVLLARQQIEEEEQRRSLCGVSVPSDISTSSATTQALLARQRAERQNEDFYQMSDEHPSSFNPLDQAMAARQRSQNDERDDYWSTTGFNETNPINRPDAVTQAMEARLRAEDGNDDHLASPVSSVMIQVMQARQRADEEKRSQWTPAPLQNPDPSGSSALIQAMLARQQAQNEYDDGYWAKGAVYIFPEEQTHIKKKKTSEGNFKTEITLCVKIHLHQFRNIQHIETCYTTTNIKL